MIYPKMNKVKVYPNENKDMVHPMNKQTALRKLRVRYHTQMRVSLLNLTFHEWLRDHAASDLYFFGWGLVEEEGGVKLVTNGISY
jgi:hypothetical protein